MDKYGQRVFRSASAFHAVIDGECEAKQLLLKPVVVYLEKSRMCQNKYTLHCVCEAAVCFNLHVSSYTFATPEDFIHLFSCCGTQ